jgi:hypothetical protein
MPHLRLVCFLTGLFAAGVIILVDLAWVGLGPGEIITVAAIGIASGFGSFLVYRKRPVKKCRD